MKPVKGGEKLAKKLNHMLVAAKGYHPNGVTEVDLNNEHNVQFGTDVAITEIGYDCLKTFITAHNNYLRYNAMGLIEPVPQQETVQLKPPMAASSRSRYVVCGLGFPDAERDFEDAFGSFEELRETEGVTGPPSSPEMAGPSCKKSKPLSNDSLQKLLIDFGDEPGPSQAARFVDAVDLADHNVQQSSVEIVDDIRDPDSVLALVQTLMKEYPDKIDPDRLFYRLEMEGRSLEQAYDKIKREFESEAMGSELIGNNLELDERLRQSDIYELLGEQKRINALVILQMFNDIDIDWLLRSLLDTDDGNVLAQELITNSKYPRNSTFTKIKNDAVTERNNRRSEFLDPHRFNAEEFVRIYEDPETYFTQEHRQMSANYRNHAQVALMNQFTGVRVDYIDEALHRHNHHYLPALRDIQNVVGGNEENINADGSKPKRPVKKKHRVPGLYLVTPRDRQEDWPEHVDEQFFREYQYAQRHQEINDLLQRRRAERQEQFEDARANGDLKMCDICGEEVLGAELVTCSGNDAHLFCKTCVKNYANVTVEQGGHVVKCMTECESSYSLEVLRQLLIPQTVDLILQRTQQQEILDAQVENIESCPFCNFMLIIDNPLERTFRCLNPTCTRVSCRQCKKESHIPLRCDEVVRGDETEMRKYIENKMAEALIRECPNCGKRLVKESGCNHMRCPCGRFMCYVCKKLLSGGYSHFRGQGAKSGECPLYTTSDQVHADPAAQAGEQARKEFLEKHPELENKDAAGSSVEVEKLVDRNPHERPVPGMAEFGMAHMAAFMRGRNRNNDGGYFGWEEAARAHGNPVPYRNAMAANEEAMRRQEMADLEEMQRDIHMHGEIEALTLRRVRQARERATLPLRRNIRARVNVQPTAAPPVAPPAGDYERFDADVNEWMEQREQRAREQEEERQREAEHRARGMTCTRPENDVDGFDRFNQMLLQGLRGAPQPPPPMRMTTRARTDREPRAKKTIVPAKQVPKEDKEKKQLDPFDYRFFLEPTTKKTTTNTEDQKIVETNEKIMQLKKRRNEHAKSELDFRKRIEMMTRYNSDMPEASNKSFPDMPKEYQERRQRQEKYAEKLTKHIDEEGKRLTQLQQRTPRVQVAPHLLVALPPVDVDSEPTEGDIIDVPDDLSQDDANPDVAGPSGLQRGRVEQSNPSAFAFVDNLVAEVLREQPVPVTDFKYDPVPYKQPAQKVNIVTNKVPRCPICNQALPRPEAVTKHLRIVHSVAPDELGHYSVAPEQLSQYSVAPEQPMPVPPPVVPPERSPVKVSTSPTAMLKRLQYPRSRSTSLKRGDKKRKPPTFGEKWSLGTNPRKEVRQEPPEHVQPPSNNTVPPAPINTPEERPEREGPERSELQEFEVRRLDGLISEGTFALSNATNIEQRQIIFVKLQTLKQRRREAGGEPPNGRLIESYDETLRAGYEHMTGPEQRAQFLIQTLLNLIDETSAPNTHQVVKLIRTFCAEVGNLAMVCFTGGLLDWVKVCTRLEEAATAIMDRDPFMCAQHMPRFIDTLRQCVPNITLQSIEQIGASLVNVLNAIEQYCGANFNREKQEQKRKQRMNLQQKQKEQEDRDVNSVRLRLRENANKMDEIRRKLKDNTSLDELYQNVTRLEARKAVLLRQREEIDKQITTIDKKLTPINESVGQLNAERDRMRQELGRRESEAEQLRQTEQMLVRLAAQVHQVPTPAVQRQTERHTAVAAGSEEDIEGVLKRLILQKGRSAVMHTIHKLNAPQQSSNEDNVAGPSTDGLTQIESDLMVIEPIETESSVELISIDDDAKTDIKTKVKEEVTTEKPSSVAAMLMQMTKDEKSAKTSKVTATIAPVKRDPIWGPRSIPPTDAPSTPTPSTPMASRHTASIPTATPNTPVPTIHRSLSSMSTAGLTGFGLHEGGIWREVEGQKTKNKEGMEDSSASLPMQSVANSVQVQEDELIQISITTRRMPANNPPQADTVTVKCEDSMDFEESN